MKVKEFIEELKSHNPDDDMELKIIKVNSDGAEFQKISDMHEYNQNGINCLGIILISCFFTLILSKEKFIHCCFWYII